MESAIAKERPLFDGSYDYVMLVEAPWQTWLERACKRDNAERDAVLKRMKAQYTREEKADVIVNNDLD